MTLANPLVRWAIAALVIALAIAAAWLKGHGAGYDERDTELRLEVAAANARARQIERDARAKLDAITRTHHQESTDAHATIDRLRADLRAGTVRLRLPGAARLPACANFATAPGAEPETRAELDPATADALVAITTDGDGAIRQLNAVIDAYGVAVEACGR